MSPSGGSDAISRRAGAGGAACPKMLVSDPKSPNVIVRSLLMSAGQALSDVLSGQASERVCSDRALRAVAPCVFVVVQEQWAREIAPPFFQAG
jgi:hypothetical protein